ncbi:MAG: hypothetical protein WEG36_11765 [Gemmatimonadota bacterium]
MASARELALRQGLRELWADHVVWTRDYIIAATTDHPSAPTAVGRLMENQEEIGAAIVPFYGADVGKGLTALLKDHIRVAGEVVAAAKMQDRQATGQLDRRPSDL